MDVSGAPTVSIVIPTYDRAAYLRETAESVLGQEGAAVELVIVDDGSTDRTPRLIAELEAEHPGRIKTTRHDNCGQALSTNRGFELASGEVLGYLSSDDLLFEGAVAKLLAALRESPDAWVAYPDFAVVDEAGEVTDRFHLEQFELREVLLNHNPILGPGAIFRRELLERLGGMDPEFPINLDFEFWFRARLVGPFVHVAEPLAGYRRHEEMTSLAARGPEMAAEPVRLLDHLYSLPDLPEELHEIRPRAYRAAHIVAATMSASDGFDPDSRFFVADRRAPRVSERHAELDRAAAVVELRAQVGRLRDALERERRARARRDAQLREANGRISRLQRALNDRPHRRLARRMRAALRGTGSAG